MINYSELVQRLRGPIKHPQQLINASHEAADAIEYLMKKNGFFNDYCEKQLTRIAELEAALKPFAEITEQQNFKDYQYNQDDCVMTAGVWGFKPDFTFKLGDLRAARKVLDGK